MYSDGKAWQSEEFLPMFKTIEQKFIYRKITRRRIAKMTKGALAARKALLFCMLGGDPVVSNQEEASREEC